MCPYVLIIQSTYKLLEDFAKPYFHKYWTVIHDVTTIWKRKVSMFTSHHFQRHYQNCGSVSTPQSGTSHKTCLRGFGRNGSISWTSAVSHEGCTSNAFKVTMKLQTFLFQMITSCISVQYLWKYGFVKSSNNLYAPVLWGVDNKQLNIFTSRNVNFFLILNTWNESLLSFSLFNYTCDRKGNVCHRLPLTIIVTLF